MEYFIFDFEKHSYLIDSFLESAALAHGDFSIKSKDWFFWKFRDNPFGKAILACACVDENIVGCVAHGKQPFYFQDNSINATLSFETFVHPEYQGKGIFSSLIKLAEKEAKRDNVDLMLNFPNLNSLKGFLKNGWKQGENPEYWIKIRNIHTILLKISELKKPFLHDSSNLSKLSPPNRFNQTLSNGDLISIIGLDYLKWRFFSFPKGKYTIIDTVSCYSILRIGYRGKIREAQVLFVNIKNPGKFCFSKFISQCKFKTEYDVISFPISKNNGIRKYLKQSLFFKVPTRTNLCYKILNQKFIKDNDIERLSLSGINFHTY